VDLLLDTHVFLWWDAGASQLGARAASLIAGVKNRVFVSAASVWEIAIKREIGRLAYDGSPAEAIIRNGFLAMPILPSHAERATALVAFHRDPFDRMLVAQAQEASLTLVTADEKIRAYDVALLWAR
jgi:PIN domain nuclease of toxin-antitoxin system